MNQKKAASRVILVLTILSCLLLTTCKFPVAEDEDDLPLKEWEVSKVVYYPKILFPRVELYFSNGLEGTGYAPRDGTDDLDWMSKLMWIPGLELGSCSYLHTDLSWNVNKQIAGDGEPLTAYFSHAEFIESEGEYWDQKDVARVRIKTESFPVTIVEY